ncbi:MAG: hypothetical protein IJS01_06740 [Lentisphaeria bacterium]|nr:hypothetical protein [Lentisphaeria bacterium]
MSWKRGVFTAVLAGLVWTAFCGDDAAELTRLRAENRRLRLELDRLRAARSQQDRDLLRFRAWLAAAADSGKLQTASDREIRLLAILSEMVRRGSRLAVQVSSVERAFRDLLGEFPIGPARQARLLLQLEQLERCAMQVSSIASVAESEEDPAAFREATVLAVNRELETAVLSVGTVHGVFPGLIYRDRDGSGQSLRIVSVRPWVSAAVPVQGDAGRIAPGMRFTVEHRARSDERISPLRMR